MMDRQNTLDFDSLPKAIDQYCILPYNELFGEYISRIMDSKKITQTNLSGRTGVPKSTLSRYLRDMEDDMKRNYIIAIVMGLELTSSQIRTALSLAGVSIDYPTKRNQIIQYCLDRSALPKPERKTIADCNLILEYYKLPVLTKKKYDRTQEMDYESDWGD